MNNNTELKIKESIKKELIEKYGIPIGAEAELLFNQEIEREYKKRMFNTSKLI